MECLMDELNVHQEPAYKINKPGPLSSSNSNKIDLCYNQHSSEGNSSQGTAQK